MGKLFLRILIVTVYAFVVAQLIIFTLPDSIELNPPVAKVLLWFLYFLMFNLNTEGSLFFDRLLDKKLPWYYNINRRLFVQIALVVIWSLITIALPFTLWYFKNGGSFIYPSTSVITFLSSIIVLFVFIGISMIRNFYKQKQNSLLEIEQLKQEKLKADYRVLQNQINPHFLFNSLNVLISEIKHNPDVAEKFTRELSKVYRYVLQSKNHDLITLQRELEFIESFIFLHKVRVGNAVDFKINVPDDFKQKQLPPLTLQILFENAIKHNIVNDKNVLRISLSIQNHNTLIVRNNLQEIDNTNSTNTGLTNLAKRFELLQQNGFKYEKTRNEFVVHIPLIEE